jgi:hypothetical protein
MEKTSVLDKLMVYNNPKFLLILGTFMIIPNSLANPVCGIAFAKILTLLSMPIEYLKFIDPLEVGGTDYLKNEIIYWSIVMLIIAVVCFVGMGTSKKCFGTLGNNVTIQVR